MFVLFKYSNKVAYGSLFAQKLRIPGFSQLRIPRYSRIPGYSQLRELGYSRIPGYFQLVSRIPGYSRPNFFKTSNVIQKESTTQFCGQIDDSRSIAPGHSPSGL